MKRFTECPDLITAYREKKRLQNGEQEKQLSAAEEKVLLAKQSSHECTCDHADHTHCDVCKEDGEEVPPPYVEAVTGSSSSNTVTVNPVRP